jgi:hypothetical protein
LYRSCTSACHLLTQRNIPDIHQRYHLPPTRQSSHNGQVSRKEEKGEEARTGTYPHADHELGTIHKREIDSVDFLSIGKRGGIGVHPIADRPIIADECFIHQEPIYQHRPLLRSLPFILRKENRKGRERKRKKTYIAV